MHALGLSVCCRAEGPRATQTKKKEKEPVSGREEGTLDSLIRLERDGGRGRRGKVWGKGEMKEGGGGGKILAWCPSKHFAPYKV